MAFFQVDRTQFPIGQGGFHSTVVDTLHHGRLSMVVDCGGSDATHRRRLIETFAQRGRQHDILAISHFDEDHINGVEALHAAGIKFKTVFLPHVKAEDYLLWMTLRISAGEVSVNELARMVQTAGRLYGGDFGPVVLVGPPGPLTPGDPGRDPSAGDNLKELLTDDAYQAVMSARGPHGRIFSCSQSLTFKDIDWLFRFYSRELAYPDEVRKIWELPFLAKLKAVVDRTKHSMPPNGWASFATDLETELSSKVPPSEAGYVKGLLGRSPSKGDPRAKPLQKLARDIQFKSGGLSCKNVLSQLYSLSESLQNYNDASMCVYSGPAERGIGARRELFSRSVQSGHWALRSQKLDGISNREVGWISTGDADFSTLEKLHDFLWHYHAEIALTSVFVLPHHGSRMSYDPNMDRLRELIANLSDRPLFIAPANPEHKKYRHPHWPVESTCRKAGDFYVVDQDLASFYRESVKTVRNLTGLMILERRYLLG